MMIHIRKLKKIQLMDFPTFLKSGPGAWFNLGGKKTFGSSKLGKFDAVKLDCHFKRIKNHIRNQQCKATVVLIAFLRNS